MLLWMMLACVSGDPTETDDTEASFPDGALVLANVHVYDAEGARVERHVVILGDTIHAELDGTVEVPPGVDRVDGAGGWVMPGLIDGHVHMTLSGTTAWAGDALEENLRMTLGFGVTSVVDVGAPVTAVRLRDRIDAGELLGPSMKVTGPMLTEVGSHPCETYNDPDYCLFASTVAEGSEAGASLVEAGTDGMKLALADADFTPWPTPRLDPDVAAAAVSEVLAADADALVVGHVDEVEDVMDALDAGVTILGHPVFGGVALTVADAQTVAAQDVPVHSTLGAAAGLGDLLDGDLDVAALEPWLDPAVADAWSWLADNPDAFDAEWIAQSDLWTQQIRESLSVLREADAVVLPASDGGYYFQPHGYGLHRELAELSALGWSNQELLDLTTHTAATYHGWDDRGLVTPGYRADLLLLAADPREDLSTLIEPVEVLLAGQRLVPDDLRSADVLLTADSAENGAFCLEDADCASGACDLVQHVCNDPCTTVYDVTGECGEDSLCLPADGLFGSDPVCQQMDQTCTLYAEDACSPSFYEETCVPGDVDTSYCFPSGEQQVGEACSWTDTTYACDQGLYCSTLSYTCFELCDPEAAEDTCSAGSCKPEVIDGDVWFGLCW